MNKSLNITLFCMAMLLPNATNRSKQFCKAPPTTHARILCSKYEKNKNTYAPPVHKEITYTPAPEIQPSSQYKVIKRSSPPTKKAKETADNPSFVYKPYTPGTFAHAKEKK